MEKPIYFVTYDRGKGELNIDDVIYNNTLQKKFTPKFIKGYNLKDNPDIKNTQVVYKNLLEKVLPRLKKMKAKGYLVAEDDALVNANAKELNRIIIKNGGAKNILWIGYQKILKKKGEVDYIVGSQLIYIPRQRIDQLERVMKESRPQHLDRFLLNKRKQIGLTVVPQKLKVTYNAKTAPDGKLVDELSRESITTGKIRKGRTERFQGRNTFIIKKKKINK